MVFLSIARSSIVSQSRYENERQDFAKFLKIDQIYSDYLQIHDDLYAKHKDEIQRIIKRAEKRAKESTS